MKRFHGIVCALLLGVAAASGQAPKSAPTQPAPTIVNEVVGLKLPAPQTVNFDEGFISLTADCKGLVKWLVLSTSVKVKFKVNPASPNDIDIAIPPYESAITVFCIGIVDGKQTEFARTDITVKGPPGPGPGPGPGPDPPPPDIKGPFWLSIIEDPLKRTDAIKLVIESDNLRAKLRDKQVTLRTFTTNDPALVSPLKFDAVLKKYGAPVMILQDDTGKALVISTLPPDVPGVLKAVAPYVGGF
jgi:hypothetical protein